MARGGASPEKTKSVIIDDGERGRARARTEKYPRTRNRRGVWHSFFLDMASGMAVAIMTLLWCVFFGVFSAIFVLNAGAQAANATVLKIAAMVLVSLWAYMAGFYWGQYEGS
jgi:hypothetical protein